MNVILNYNHFYGVFVKATECSSSLHSFRTPCSTEYTFPSAYF